MSVHLNIVKLELVDYVEARKSMEKQLYMMIGTTTAHMYFTVRSLMFFDWEDRERKQSEPRSLYTKQQELELGSRVKGSQGVVASSESKVRWSATQGSEPRYWSQGCE